MNNRIFPINENENPKAVVNRCSYLEWLNFEQQSIKDYISYNYPPYTILGEKVYYFDQNNNKGSSSITDNDDAIIDSMVYQNSDIYVYCLAGLSYHQGIYNRHFNSRIYHGSKADLETIMEDVEEDKKTNVLLSITDVFPLSSIAFAKQWTHSGKQKDLENPEFKEKSFYKIIPRSEPAFYQPFGQENGVSFSVLEDALSMAGQGMIFNIDTKPTRYTILRTSDSFLGKQKNWIQQAGSFNSDGSLNVYLGTSTGKLWTNSYPLMSGLQIEKANGNNICCEEFIMDCEESVGTVKLDNIMFYYYNINTNNESDWKEDLKIVLY